MLKCSISQARRFGFILFFTNIYDIFIHTPVIKSNSHVVYEQHQCCQNICWRWKTTIPLVLDIKLWNISRWMLTPQKPHKYLTGCLLLVAADRHIRNVWLSKQLLWLFRVYMALYRYSTITVFRYFSLFHMINFRQLLRPLWFLKDLF